MKPLHLPAGSVFCPACLKMMPKGLWDALYVRDVPCDPAGDCRASVAHYQGSATLYAAIRNPPDHSGDNP